MIIGANNAIYLKNLFGLRSGIKKVHNTANIKQAKTVRELRRYKIYAKTPIDTRITNLQNIFFIDTKLSKRIMTTNKTQTAVPFGLPILSHRSICNGRKDKSINSKNNSHNC